MFMRGEGKPIKEKDRTMRSLFVCGDFRLMAKALLVLPDVAITKRVPALWYPIKTADCCLWSSFF